MHVVMVEPDIMVDKRGLFILRVLFDCEECDQVLEDCGIEVMGPVQREAIKMDGDDGGNGGSHVQEAFGRRSKMEGHIYPGNDPEQIMPNIKWQLRVQEACCGKEKTAVAERSVLRRSTLE